MMKRYRRLPSIVVLLIAAAFGAHRLKALARDQAGAAGSLEELERQIARGKTDAPTWFAYGQRLTEARRFEQAALAFRRVLEKEPSNRQAKFGCAITLAQTVNPEEFYVYMRELTYAEPKLALEIFDRRECQPWLKEPRFATLQKEAKAQAMD